MDIKDAVFFRRSVRKYTEHPVGKDVLSDIDSFYRDITPLYPDIRVKYEIVDKSDISCILPWLPPQLIVIFSEDKRGTQENAGFIFQQLELYMQSIGIGTCWLGMGKLKAHSPAAKDKEGLLPVMVMAFGHPDGSIKRRSASEFRRRGLSDIADTADERLEPARLAPSGINTQPWYFTHEKGRFNMFIKQKGILKINRLHNMNRFDAGIALAHMYVSNRSTFRFFYAEDAAKPKGYEYIGSFYI